MNKLFKTLILILYTSAIFIVALLIIKSTNKGANFEKYTSKSYDDNIAVVTQVIEKRSSKEETDTDYEKSEYDIHLFIKKLSSVDVKNLYAYFAIQTAEGVRYVQSTSGKAMEDTSSVISTIKVSNSSSNKFAVNEVVVDEEHDEIIYMNRIPDKIYVKIVYDTIVEKETIANELNYTIDYNKVNTQGFENFEYRAIESTKIDSKDDCLEIKFTRKDVEATATAPEYDEFRFTQLRVASSKLPENTKIENIKVEVVGEISNKSMVDKEHFEEYISLFTYEGALKANVANPSIGNSRSVKVNKEYNINKVYFRICVEFENGEKVNYNYYVLTSELKQS